MLYNDGYKYLHRPGFLLRTLVQASAYVLMAATVLMDLTEKYTSGVSLNKCRWTDAASEAYYVLQPILWTIGLMVLTHGLLQGKWGEGSWASSNDGSPITIFSPKHIYVCSSGWKTALAATMSSQVFVSLSRLVYGEF